MLGAYDVRYMPHIAIKGQVLADFVAEFTEGMIDDEKRVADVLMVSASAIAIWEVYMDGVAN